MYHNKDTLTGATKYLHQIFYSQIFEGWKVSQNLPPFLFCMFYLICNFHFKKNTKIGSFWNISSQSGIAYTKHSVMMSPNHTVSQFTLKVKPKWVQYYMLSLWAAEHFHPITAHLLINTVVRQGATLHFTSLFIKSSLHLKDFGMKVLWLEHDLTLVSWFSVFHPPKHAMSLFICEHCTLKALENVSQLQQDLISFRRRLGPG